MATSDSRVSLPADGADRDKRKPRPWSADKLGSHYGKGSRWWRTRLAEMRRLGVLHQHGRVDWATEEAIEAYLTGRFAPALRRRGRR